MVEKEGLDIAHEAARNVDIEIVEWLDYHPEHFKTFQPILTSLRLAIVTLVAEIDKRDGY